MGHLNLGVITKVDLIQGRPNSWAQITIKSISFHLSLTLMFFTQLVHELGVPPSLSFQDVLTLNNPTLFPRPALALILVFPSSLRLKYMRLRNQ